MTSPTKVVVHVISTLVHEHDASAPPSHEPTKVPHEVLRFMALQIERVDDNDGVLRELDRQHHLHSPPYNFLVNWFPPILRPQRVAEDALVLARRLHTR